METNSIVKERTANWTNSLPRDTWNTHYFPDIDRRFETANCTPSQMKFASDEYKCGPSTGSGDLALGSRSPDVNRTIRYAWLTGQQSSLNCSDTSRGVQDMLCVNDGTGIQGPYERARVWRSVSSPDDSAQCLANRTDSGAISALSPPPLIGRREGTHTTRAALSPVGAIAIGAHQFDDLSSAATARRDTQSPFQSLDRATLRSILKHPAPPNGTPDCPSEPPPGFKWVMVPISGHMSAHSNGADTLAALQSQACALRNQQQHTMQPQPPLLRRREMAATVEAVLQPANLRSADESGRLTPELQRQRGTALLESGARDRSGATSPVFSWASSDVSMGPPDYNVMYNSDTASRRVVRFESEPNAAAPLAASASEHTLVSADATLSPPTGAPNGSGVGTRSSRRESGETAAGARAPAPEPKSSSHSPLAKLWHSLRRSQAGARKRDSGTRTGGAARRGAFRQKELVRRLSPWS